MRAERSGFVRAAGGIVLRGGESQPDVLLVHRPRYDDWTFPKGKCDAGEPDEDAARREVEEETGLRCTLGREIDGTSYTDGKGRPKVVRYWLMTPVEGSFVPNDEVDEVIWLTAGEARRTLTYEHDRLVLDRALA